MAKRKKHQMQAAHSDQDQPAAPQSQGRQPRKFGWIPRWGWLLIFLVPLILSELLFYRVGRTVSMILFPIAWIGFWVSVMHRGGWPILKKREDR